MRRIICCFIFYCLFVGIASANTVLNVYNWSGYIPISIIHEFTRETGIEVNYSLYDSNDMLYAKLKGNPDSGYDVVFPSSYYVKKMVAEGMLKKLDKKAIANYSDLNPALLNRSYDPGNKYSLPFVWGATGIVVNDRYHKVADFKDWASLWDSGLKNQLLLLNDLREVFSIALIRLGYSINDRNPHHIKQAFELLKKLMPNVRVINTQSADNLFLDEDVTLGIGWNGDMHQVSDENKHVKFIYPRNHFAIWIDCVTVPVNAPHPKQAMRFINFILRPDIALAISKAMDYPPINQKAMAMLPEAMKQDQTFNPSTAILKRAEVQGDVGAAIGLYIYYWQRLKLSI